MEKLRFEIYLACDELPSASSGLEPVESSRVEFGAWNLEFNLLFLAIGRSIKRIPVL
jgi:hypothetical protein